MKCLITGGAGFIGSNLARYLLNKSMDIRILDNFSTGKKENLAEIKDSVELIEGDIRDFELLLSAADCCEVIFHQAALPSVPRSISNPAASNEVNITGTLNVLIAARDKGVRRVVSASSSSVYGDNKVFPRVETLGPSPMSPYAVTKMTGEYYSRVFSNVYGFETVCLRYFNVFGARQDPDSQYAAVIPKFVKALFAGEPPLIHGDGEQSRDFTYIDFVSEINYLAATAGSGFCGEVFNVGCGRSFTVNELLGLLKQLTGKPHAEHLHGEPRPGDVKHSLASIEKARNLLGYQPVSDFEKELSLTVDWFKNSGILN